MPPVVIIESNLSRVAGRLETMQVAIPGILATATEAAGEAVARIAETSVHDATPVKTGALRDSTYAERTRTGATSQLIEIGQREAVDWKGQKIPLSTLLTLGTAPHDIYPLNKKALFWEGAEHPVSMVHHPGTQPNPYVRDAMQTAAAPIAIILHKTAQESASAIVHVIGA